MDIWRPGALCKQCLHDWPKGPPAVALSVGSSEPLLRDLAQRPELRILVHQHGALQLGRGGDPGIRHGEGMTGLDRGGPLDELITAGHPLKR